MIKYFKNLFLKLRKKSKTFPYPICLDLSGVKCLIVGGNHHAEEKIKSLLSANALITVISENPSTHISSLAYEGKVLLKKRAVCKKDIESSFLIMASEQDPELNKKLFRWCAKKNRLFNAVDDTPNCRFIIPAISREKNIHISVCTSGGSPALASFLRDKISQQILTPDVGELGLFLAKWRPEVKKSIDSFDKRKEFWQMIVHSDVSKPYNSRETNRWMKEQIKKG